MDDQMIARLLATYEGAQPTVKNVNAARQFFATNPEIAEKRAMGLRGSGIDDNSDIFGAQLEKFMQAAETEPPPGRVEVGPIEKVEAPQAAPTQRAAPAKMSNMPAQPGQNRQANYGDTGPITREAARGGRGFGLDDFLTALLGLSSTAGRKMMSGVDPNDPRLPPQVQGPEKLEQLTGPGEQKRLTYQPKLEDNVSDTTRIKTNELPTAKVEGDPALTEEARKRQLQAEIDAENANAKRLQDQIMERQRAQIETKKLLDAGRKYLGRR